VWKRSKQVFFGHAQLPTVEDRGDRFRVFYSYRENGCSCISYLELNKSLELVYQNAVPVLSPGIRGCFDDKGVMPSCMVGPVMYYTGWNTDKGEVPYGHGIGAAIWNEQKNEFERLFEGPILDRGVVTPYLVNSPFVAPTSSGWKMWFCNGSGWDGNFPKYSIFSCESHSPLFQSPSNFIHVVGEPYEACSRPFVLNDKLFFSKKTKNTQYRIHCFDGELVEAVELSVEGWDSEMMCYPYFCNNYMFYNGNGYGATGIGICTKN